MILADRNILDARGVLDEDDADELENVLAVCFLICMSKPDASSTVRLKVGGDILEEGRQVSTVTLADRNILDARGELDEEDADELENVLAVCLLVLSQVMLLCQHRNPHLRGLWPHDPGRPQHPGCSGRAGRRRCRQAGEHACGMLSHLYVQDRCK